MSVLSKRIKKERESLGITRDDLAKKIGVSYSAISMYEQGNREPNNAILMKLCEVFNCSMDYLLGKSYYKNYEEFKKIDELVSNYERTPEETKVICNALNYINTHPNEPFGEVIEQFTHDFPIDKKDLFKSIINHLHYIYDGTVPNNINNNIQNFPTSIKKANQYNLYKYKFDKIYMCPVYGEISAGQPNWAEECIEGRLPIDPELMGIVNPEEHFFLRVNGESMNKVVKNGAFALIHKQDYVENGEIAVVLVNGNTATLKKFTKKDNVIVLTPESDDDSFEQQIYTKDVPIKVIGKYVGKMEINQ